MLLCGVVPERHRNCTVAAASVTLSHHATAHIQHTAAYSRVRIAQQYEGRSSAWNEQLMIVLMLLVVMLL